MMVMEVTRFCLSFISNQLADSGLRIVSKIEWMQEKQNKMKRTLTHSLNRLICWRRTCTGRRIIEWRRSIKSIGYGRNCSSWRRWQVWIHSILTVISGPLTVGWVHGIIQARGLLTRRCQGRCSCLSWRGRRRRWIRSSITRKRCTSWWSNNKEFSSPRTRRTKCMKKDCQRKDHRGRHKKREAEGKRREDGRRERKQSDTFMT